MPTTDYIRLFGLVMLLCRCVCAWILCMWVVWQQDGTIEHKDDNDDTKTKRKKINQTNIYFKRNGEAIPTYTHARSHSQHSITFNNNNLCVSCIIRNENETKRPERIRLGSISVIISVLCQDRMDFFSISHSSNGFFPILLLLFIIIFFSNDLSKTFWK